MSKANIVLTVIFGFLLIISTTEIIYLVVSNRTHPSLLTNSDTKRANHSDGEDNNQAISEDIISMLRAYRKGTIIASTLSMDFKGEVSDIEKGEKNNKKKNLLISLKQGNENMAIQLEEKDSPVTSYIDKSTLEKRPFDISNPAFSIGDTLLIKMTLDLNKPFNNSTKSIEITVE